MNAPKPTKSLAGQTCPACDSGRLRLVQIDHTEEVASDNPVEIRGIWVDRCDHCGEIVFPADTTRFIESVVAEQTEQLDPRELEMIREDLGIRRQDEMSEILGLGAKTFHKWESGAQFPTRSMCYYIRVLAEFPDALDWLRRRAWRNRNRLAQPQTQADFAAMFPDLASLGIASERCNSPRNQEPHQKRLNPALGLTRVAFVLK
jgi:putative zinc finger/helix-turn-helix YgiT family protein